ncbi:DUF1116 domain-containing protein [Desulfofustis limnaeus]|jgi:hypothetical protein|uniref:DUF1116 domain-containing protein n=1 Tax=Desulfofustis limnaeus TaxID=2740163 RepID=A0ABN6M7M8_9BACT|nr:DUF1116 domain-containing protein [Desulfofustis limnaeus]MDX9895528.1 DUF1116 domain-containing protein [Desulfofustis sp.]BDD87945.1 hypothetical protein DPPLL_23100 [Desulfofustis limnaeus]
MNIETANQQCLANIQASTAVWSDIRQAGDTIPGMNDYLVLHAGPPLTWEQMCGPMRGAITGACIFEGWATGPEEVARLAESGKLTFDSSHHHHAIGPMSGIITPSMQVNVVKNDAFGIETYATLYMGIGKVLRHGAFDEEVMAKLRWMNHDLAPLLKAALRETGGIDIKSIVAQALQMGDELHNRNKASNALLVNSLVQPLIKVGSKEAVLRAIDFIDKAGHFILNTVMAGSKGMLDAGGNIDGSTVVTAIARNGYETGIRVSGLGDRWFTAPAPTIDGVYFPGFGPEDANPDLGDSAITETIGLGSFSMAGAPAVVEYIGGTAQFAQQTSLQMYEITIGEHQMYKLPPLNFRGTPLGIDIRRVVETGITPVINTGIACRRPGVGQIGAGLTAAPLACFVKALEAFAEHSRAGQGN